MNLEDRGFTVVGAARSGLAAANLLARRGADVRLIDHAAGKPRPEALDARAGYQAGTNDPRPGDVAVLSPGIKEVSPVRAQIAAIASEVIGEVELFYRLCPAPVIAVTGTDGKSTTTTMIGAIVAADGRPNVVGGNLGNPLCDELDAVTPEHVVVAEISAFQLTTCVDFAPQVAVVTNIAEDHVDYHGSFEAYQAAKRRIWARMGPRGVLVLNADDPFIAEWEWPDEPRILTFSVAGREDASARYAGGELYVGGERLMTRAELPLLGEHNVGNALAAALAASAFGVPLAAARRGLMGYEALPHRLRTVATIDGVRWINDSKATNPNAASAGLRAMEQPTILLAGGSDKEADFEAFGALVRQKTMRALLFGQTREQLREAIGPEHPVEVLETMNQAVTRARELARPGDAVLLCPACASFDQFDSYEHRGQVFEQLVHDLERGD